MRSYATRNTLLSRRVVEREKKRRGCMTENDICSTVTRGPRNDTGTQVSGFVLEKKTHL